ncbi:hypothetical protein BGX38DRAFT_1204984, partial [Terfezia claveryi]
FYREFRAAQAVGSRSEGPRAPLLMNSQSKVGEEVITLRQALRPVTNLAAQVDSPSGCSVYDLVRQMGKRFSTQPTDKVAGLLYLLRTSQLPTYDAGVSDEVAWARCFHVLPFARKIEILFDFPYRAIVDDMEADLDPAYDHSLAVWPENHWEPEPSLNVHLKHIWRGCLFVSDIWAISQVQVEAVADELNEYEIRALRPGDFEPKRAFDFYCPYKGQYPIESLAPSKLYTLATSNPDQSYNWVVCELVQGQEAMRKAADGTTEIVKVEVLRKVGVLRTDSCSELVLGVGEKYSVLGKINALFI